MAFGSNTFINQFSTGIASSGCGNITAVVIAVLNVGILQYPRYPPHIVGTCNRVFAVGCAVNCNVLSVSDDTPNVAANVIRVFSSCLFSRQHVSVIEHIGKCETVSVSGRVDSRSDDTADIGGSHSHICNAVRVEIISYIRYILYRQLGRMVEIGIVGCSLSRNGSMVSHIDNLAGAAVGGCKTANDAPDVICPLHIGLIVDLETFALIADGDVIGIADKTAYICAITSHGPQVICLSLNDRMACTTRDTAHRRRSGNCSDIDKTGKLSGRVFSAFDLPDKPAYIRLPLNVSRIDDIFNDDRT